jgi:hypothetical protein
VKRLKDQRLNPKYETGIVTLTLKLKSLFSMKGGSILGNSSIGAETSQTKSEKEASKPPYQNYGEILNQKSKGSH